MARASPDLHIQHLDSRVGLCNTPATLNPSMEVPGSPTGSGANERPSGMSRLLIRPAASGLHAVVSSMPRGFFTRTTQFSLDAAVCSLSLYLAYQLRFDNAVPPGHRAVMWAWMLVL